MRRIGYKCTVCREQLYAAESANIKEHPDLRVIICRVGLTALSILRCHQSVLAANGPRFKIKAVTDCMLRGQMFVNTRSLLQSCYNFFMDGEFTQDEDGFDNQCSWCGEGGHLMICDYCTSAFCKKCVRNNFKREMLKRIEDDSTKWRCFKCDPKPLASHIRVAGELTVSWRYEW